jgi:hypothetical protein
MYYQYKEREDKTMSINERIDMLLKRLAFLGYYPFQMKQIIQEAIGSGSFEETNYIQRIQIITALEKYEKLGSEYLCAYSK